MDRLREECRVFCSNLSGGFCVFTCFKDIHAILQDPDTSGQHPHGLSGLPYTKTHSFLMLDPPEHTAYRKLMAPMFTPRMMAKLEPIVKDAIRSHIAMIAPPGQCNFADDFCMVPSSAMCCGLIGTDPSNFRKANHRCLRR